MIYNIRVFDLVFAALSMVGNFSQVPGLFHSFPETIAAWGAFIDEQLSSEDIHVQVCPLPLPSPHALPLPSPHALLLNILT